MEIIESREIMEMLRNYGNDGNYWKCFLLLIGLEAAYSWEQEEEGRKTVKERGVPGGQEPEQDQEDEEEWSRQTRYPRQGSIMKFFLQRKCPKLFFWIRELILEPWKVKKKDVFFLIEPLLLFSTLE